MANMVNASYLHSGFSVPGLDRTKSYRFQSFFYCCHGDIDFT